MSTSPSDPKPPPGLSTTSLGSGQRLVGPGRDQFAADELAIVLSHFDIGTIASIKEFPRGSRRAPKLLVRSDKGTYLLKRRAIGKDDPFKVAFCHDLQIYLVEKQFPLPNLIGTKNDNNSMLQCKGNVYELFEYISGTGFDSSEQATIDAGKVLALFQKLLLDFQSEYEPARGSYHGARSVARSMQSIPQTLARINADRASQQKQTIEQTIQFLHSSYNTATVGVNELGLPDWPPQIVHSDWHPGNMLFRGQSVVAVLDYDAARLQQRVLDVANGALQFSILGGGDDPASWPSHLDTTRFKCFLEGFESVPESVLAKAELRAIPLLMIEALIAETVIPIAITGSFANMDGLDFLQMVQKKVRWLQNHTDELSRALEG